MHHITLPQKLTRKTKWNILGSSKLNKKQLDIRKQTQNEHTSLLDEVSIITDGLTGGGGIGRTCRIIQSGRAYFGLRPKSLQSSSVILFRMPRTYKNPSNFEDIHPNTKDNVDQDWMFTLSAVSVCFLSTGSGSCSWSSFFFLWALYSAVIFIPSIVILGCWAPQPPRLFFTGWSESWPWTSISSPPSHLVLFLQASKIFLSLFLGFFIRNACLNLGSSWMS